MEIRFFEKQTNWLPGPLRSLSKSITMGAMVKLQKLKNNRNGQLALHSLLGNEDPLKWLTSVLPVQPQSENRDSWKLLLLEFEEELKTLLQHYDPVIRYQSCSILLFSDFPVTRRLLWEIFHDSHYDLRTLMVRVFSSHDRQKLYNTLFRIYLRDPVFSVRQNALIRIKKDFADLYSLKLENLEDEEKIHCLELLDTHSAHDHSLALRFMEERIPGVVLAASIYLEKTGSLDKMISSASGSDLEDLNRKLKILKIASAHQITSFLDKKENFKSKGSLYLAVEILKTNVNSRLFSQLMRQVFDLKGQSVFVRDIQNEALTCLLSRKDPESFTLIGEMLGDHSMRENHRVQLLENLPAEGANQFYPVLHQYLLDRQFTHFTSLLKAFDKIPLSLCLSDLYALIRCASEKEVQKRAFILLSQYQDFTSTLFLMENLSLLNVEEMESLGIEVFRKNRSRFLYTADKIFKENDSLLHQKLMHLCSLSGIRDFLPVMEKKLSDSDPESRIRAVWSLKQLDAEEFIPDILPLLYDPVSEVRSRTAEALIQWNRMETFHDLISILNDRTESSSVQDSIIRSMGESDNSKTVEILVTLLDTNPELAEEIQKALLHKRSSRDIRHIVDLYKMASKEAKVQLNRLFKELGEGAEPYLMEQLTNTEDLQTRHNLCTILDSTGYVEFLVGVLRSSSSAKRLEAAEKLCIIGTLKASRGLLFGARDINKNIRIMSLKALVRIQKNTEVLTALENDPDKKVRRYAAWAKERIKAELLP